jgi:glycosyltransferase involved in cell wall biosynthesis
MRVLHIYSGNLYGGVESMLATLARCTAHRTDVTHEFALCFQGRLSEELDGAGASVTHLGPVRVRSPWTVRAARRRLAALLRTEQYSIAICHSPWPLALFGATVRRCSAVPLGFWLHDAVTGEHWTERWARRVVPDVAICNSCFTKAHLPCLFEPQKTAVIYCPVAPAEPLALEKRNALRERAGVSPDDVAIVHVGRMDAVKGHRTLIRALSLVPAATPWKCLIVGGPQKCGERRYFDALRAEVQRLNLDRQIAFLGDRTDARSLMQAGDVLCQPNEKPEAFGIALVEALSAGLPVVTTDIGGGAAEIVNDECGILTPPHPEAVAVALQRLIDDPSLRNQLASSGPRRADALSGPELFLNSLHSVLNAT